MPFPSLSRRHAIIGTAPFFVPSTVVAADEHHNVDNVRTAYDDYAPQYDVLDGGAVAGALGFPDQRRDLLQQASGDVLECAVGTGLNLQFYQPSSLTSFTAIDLSPGMLAQASKKASSLHLPSPSFLTADIVNLPFGDNSFDTVVDTFSLCVFTDPLAALRSMARVVRRGGGRLLLLEHTRSSSPVLGWYQDVTAGPVAAMGKGCVWNQDVLGMVKDAGLEVDKVTPHLGGLVLSITAVKK